MEIFNFERHMNDFLKDKITVNCLTEEDAVHFLKILEDEYCIKWIRGSGDNLSDYNNWDIHKNKTCYSSEKLGFQSIEWHNFYGYKVLQYNISEQTTIKQTTIEENINVKQTKKRRIFILEGE